MGINCDGILPIVPTPICIHPWTLWGRSKAGDCMIWSHENCTTCELSNSFSIGFVHIWFHMGGGYIWDEFRLSNLSLVHLWFNRWFSAPETHIFWSLEIPIFWCMNQYPYGEAPENLGRTPKSTGWSISIAIRGLYHLFEPHIHTHSSMVKSPEHRKIMGVQIAIDDCSWTAIYPNFDLGNLAHIP